MEVSRLTEGMLVVHPSKPEWGPGKVVKIVSPLIYVLFRDVPGREAKAISTAYVSLAVAPNQMDDILDNLPPLVPVNGKWALPEERLTVQQAISQFHDRFKLGFEDPTYIGDAKLGERQYKWAAHEMFESLLGSGQFEQLLEKDLTDLIRRAKQCIAKVNLLSVFEVAALKDAFMDECAGRRFFETLLVLLRSGEITEDVFAPYAKAVCDLPADKGRVATWPVATILPFLAQPDRHLFIKPEVTQNAAARLGFSLRYKPAPNWITYEAALRMAHIYSSKISALKPRDMIDVQSFIYVACGGYERLGI